MHPDATYALLLLLAKMTVVLGAGLALTRLLRRASAGTRHLVWLASLAALLVVPAVQAWTPLRVAILPAWTAAAAVDAPRARGAVSAPTAMHDPTLHDVAPDAAITTHSAHAATPADVPAPATSVAPAADASRWRAMLAAIGMLGTGRALALLWLAGALAVGAWLALGWLAARGIVRRAQPVDGPDWLDPLYEIADRVGLDEVPRLVRSADARMPFACGLAQPTIVLPRDCDAWTLDRRRAVLLHELAHVRRRDLAGHTLSRLVCALYWFHPLVWMAAARLRAESEQACDDLAVACGTRAADYAEHLLDIVVSVRGDATPAVAIAMARRSEFEGRMLAILDPERPRTAPSRRQAASLVAVLGGLAVLVGAARPAVAERAVAERAVDGGTVAASRAEASTPEGQRDTLREEVRADAAARLAVAPLDDVTSAAIADARAGAQAAAHGSVQGAVGASVRAVGESAAALGLDVARAVVPSVTRSVVQSLIGAATGAATGARPAPSPAPAMAMEMTMQGPDGARLVFRSGDSGTAASKARTDERVAMLATVLRTDTSAALRRVAAWGLSDHVGRPEARAALTQAVRRDASPVVREMAAWALTDAERDVEARAALEQAVRADRDAKVRATSAWALGDVGTAESVRALADALGDESADVRLRAAWAIGSLEPRTAPAALLDRLADREPRVRRAAAWALRNIEDPAAIPALRAAFRRESESSLRVDYLRVLTSLGEQSVETLRELLDSPDAGVREQAVRALAGRSQPDPWPWPWPDPRPFP